MAAFTEIIPYSLRKVSSKLSLNLGRINAGDADALQAVKLDPAVLEAQVTIATRPHSPNITVCREDRALVATSRAHSLPSLHPDTSNVDKFERMVMMHKAALLSLSPEQYDLLIKFAATLRKQRVANQINLECAFCKNNGESLSWYTTHALKNWRGQVLCPVLRAYRCPRCGASGDRAHTAKYCPEYDLADPRANSP